MKASEIILDSHIFEGTTRGQALELLTELVFDRYERDSEQLSNGNAIDAILLLLDCLEEKD